MGSIPIVSIPLPYSSPFLSKISLFPFPEICYTRLMYKYPSYVVEQTRESIHYSKNPLEVVLLLTCLVKSGMREDRKKSLLLECVSSNGLRDDEIVALHEMLDRDAIYGVCLNRDQKRLGCEPGGKYRHEEYIVGRALECIFDIHLYRSEHPMYDFVVGYRNWDLIGPVAPYYFDSVSFIKSLNNHLENKRGLDTLVVCTVTLPQKEQEEISNLFKNDRRCENINILLLDNSTISQTYDFNSYYFLC